MVWVISHMRLASKRLHCCIVAQSARNEKMRIKSNVNLGALLDAEVSPLLPCTHICLLLSLPAGSSPLQ